mmetsp:Transcript_7133/g.26703  ORF Transcript_7133/g.26703 Transcript_7133/m.26703 type:complete len:133 (+) Transcript_7133:1752-2150(+)
MYRRESKHALTEQVRNMELLLEKKSNEMLRKMRLTQGKMNVMLKEGSEFLKKMKNCPNLPAFLPSSTGEQKEKASAENHSVSPVKGNDHSMIEAVDKLTQLFAQFRDLRSSAIEEKCLKCEGLLVCEEEMED